MLLIVISPHHTSPTPLKVNLGTHTLIITSESATPDDAQPAPGTAGPCTEASLLLDNEEAYKLCICLHTLFQQEADHIGPASHGKDEH